jgi:hypothetical protein
MLSSSRAIKTPKQIFDRERERSLKKEVFAKAVDSDIRAFRKIEGELRTEALASSRHEQRQQAIAENWEREREASERKAQQRGDTTSDYNVENQSSRCRPGADAATLHERKNTLRARAYALQSRNEEARRALVQSCYDKQWLSSCDDARIINGQALQRFMTDFQRRQIEEKRNSREQRVREETALDNKVEKYCQKMADTAERIKAKSMQRERDDLCSLEAQIRDKQSKQQHEKAQQRAEDAREIAQIQIELTREKELAEKRKKADWLEGQKIRAFNEQRLGLMRARAEEERQQDMTLLNYALEEEAKSVAAEKDRGVKAREESRLYRKYLEELMQKEVEDEREIESIRLAKEEEVWEQREAVLQEREAKKKALWLEIDATRQQQLLYKALTAAEESEAESTLVGRWEAEQKAEEEECQRSKEAHRLAILSNREVLEKQTKALRHRVALEEQQEYLRTKHVQKEEADQQRRRQEQAGVARIHFPLRSQKWTD